MESDEITQLRSAIEAQRAENDAKRQEEMQRYQKLQETLAAETSTPVAQVAAATIGEIRMLHDRLDGLEQHLRLVEEGLFRFMMVAAGIDPES